LLFIEVGIEEGVQLVLHDASEAVLHREVLQVNYIVHLLIDRDDVLCLESAIAEWVIERFEVLELFGPVFLLEEDSLIFPEVVDLCLDSFLDQGLSLVESADQVIVGKRELLLRKVLQVLNRINVGAGLAQEKLLIQEGEGVLIDLLSVFVNVVDGVSQERLVLNNLLLHFIKLLSPTDGWHLL
jgi:hypothetical protein